MKPPGGDLGRCQLIVAYVGDVERLVLWYCVLLRKEQGSHRIRRPRRRRLRPAVGRPMGSVVN